MFGGSSRSVNGPNQDGSTNVFCFQCRDFIGTSNNRISRALCAICQAAEEGKALPPDILLQYRVAKGAKATIQALNIPEPVITTPEGIKKKRFSFGSVAGEVLSAIGRFASGEKTEAQAVVNAPGASAQIAKAKRRPRLFGNIKAGQDVMPTPLGSMEDVDKGKLK